MDIQPISKDMNIIAALDDEPNDVGGLTAAELKAKFDEGGVALKAYINETLLPALIAFTERTDNPHGVTAEQVGLGNCDNTSDLEKPVSTPQQAALDLKAGKADVLLKNNTDAYTPTAPYHPATKEYADSVAASAVLGQLPDGSVTPEKLSDSVKQAIESKAALTHAARHASDGADPITPASIGAAAALTLTCTVPVSWTASGRYFYQQVSVPGMLETDNPVADILPGTDNDANKLYAEAWAKVQSIDTLDGAVKLWCTSMPGTAFPVQFKVVR